MSADRAGRSPQDEVATLADWIARRRVGGVVAFHGPAGAVVEGRGDAGRGQAPDGTTLFEIGSVTKVFTALLLADAVGRGEVRLDTPLREVLPVGVGVPSRGGAEITLQHLATHTSGLPRSPLSIGLAENVAYLRHGSDPYAGFTPAMLLENLSGASLKRVPGTSSVRYSNFGFGVLGAALGHVAGRGYGELVRERICLPLGMADTVVAEHLDADQRDRMAIGHRSRRKTAEPWPLVGPPGAGALRSTAVDLLRFLAAQLDPPTSPLGDAIRLMQAPAPGGPDRMGLGWHRAGPRQTLWHNGGTGGFRSLTALQRDAGTAVIVLINQSSGADRRGLGLLHHLSAPPNGLAR